MQSGTQNRVAWRVVKWTFLVIGPLFLLGALISTRSTQMFLRRSVTTEGRIVALKPVHSTRDNSVTYAPVFRFDVPGSHFATVVSHTSSNPPVFKLGEFVTVHYEQGHPQDAVIDSFGQLWLGDVIFGSLGTVFTGISILVLVATRKRRPRDVISPDSDAGILRR
jgi:hypothetical protein